MSYYIKYYFSSDLLVKILDFVGMISHQGRMRVIVVPKRMHVKLDKIENKQVRISVEDILD